MILKRDNLNRVKVGIGILLLLGVSLITFSCKPQGEGEEYMIPRGYEGYIFIFYDQKDGTPMESDKDGSRIYRINNNGILKTRFSPNKGDVLLSKIRYYYVDSAGNKEALKCDLIAGEMKDSFAVFFPKNGAIGQLLWSEFVIDSAKYITKYDLGRVNIKDIYNSTKAYKRWH